MADDTRGTGGLDALAPNDPENRYKDGWYAWKRRNRYNADYAAQGVAPQLRGLNKTEEIGMVDYVPFDADQRLEHWTRDKAKKLNGYGWADRKKGLIHIPIDEAMKEVVRQAATSNGGAAAPGGGATK